MIDFELPERYLLQGRLGGGSYGDVYLGLDRKLDRKVAIKLMKGALDSESVRNAAEVFRREAKLLALIDHVNVVKVFDYDVAGNGTLFLVMEYLDGRVVSDMRLPLDLDVVSQFVSQIGSALQSAHERGLIHRDLKPGNVMFAGQGGRDSRFVLLDLGIAKLMNVAQGSSNTVRSMTFAGHGTPLYMAPEQIDEGDVDARADVYAFGSTLYELLTGIAPFGHIRGTHYSVIKAVMTEHPRRLLDVAPHMHFPDGLEELIDECLRKDPTERPPTIGLMVERFQTIVSREKNALLDTHRRKELELHKETIYPGASSQKDTDSQSSHSASTSVGGQDPYATLGPKQLGQSSRSVKPQWAAERGRSSWKFGVIGLVVLVLLSVAAFVALKQKEKRPIPLTPVAITLQPTAAQQIGEDGEWTHLVTATLPEGAAHPLVYSLGPNAPEGMKIDPVTGRIRWKPAESQGPGKYPVVVEVESPDAGVQRTREEFEVTVGETNSPPQLEAIANQMVLASGILDLTLVAHDTDLPQQSLEFSFGDHPPAGARLDPTTGRILWTPGSEQLGHDFDLVVRVSDGVAKPVESKFQVTVLAEASITFPEKVIQSPINISFTRNSLGMELAAFNPAEFLMGSLDDEENRQDDEFQHTVQLSHPLLFGRHEVTVGQFARFVAENPNYRMESQRAGQLQKNWRDAFATQGDDYPVVNVSWNDAQAFCKWLTRIEGRRYRLPTEAEWEYACRAGTSSRFFASNDEDVVREFANLLDQSLRESLQDPELAAAWNDGYPNTSPVGKYLANSLGIYDMEGNVWEWCSDRYAADYYRKSPPVDPTGPEAGDLHVIRGGSWLSQPRDARCATRDARTAKTFQNNIGFRVVRIP